MQRSKTFRLALVATGEWVMVLPAAVFLMAAALRFLQPSQYEPAHTSWILSQWAATHISRLGAATLFILVPSLAILLGSATLLLAWREDSSVRDDVTLAVTILRRRLSLGLLMTGTILAAVICLFAVAHVVLD
jgi:hypothetical protein